MNKRSTIEQLRFAILRIQKGRPQKVSASQRISIRLVAKEAGVSASLIHNRYPDIAKQIREVIERSKPSAASKGTSIVEQRLTMLRNEVSVLQTDLKRIASINATLTLQARALKDRNDKLLEERTQLIEQLNRAQTGTVFQIKGRTARNRRT